jgi:hypothetical protein
MTVRDEGWGPILQLNPYLTVSAAANGFAMLTAVRMSGAIRIAQTVNSVAVTATQTKNIFISPFGGHGLSPSNEYSFRAWTPGQGAPNEGFWNVFDGYTYVNTGIAYVPADFISFSAEARADGTMTMTIGSFTQVYAGLGYGRPADAWVPQFLVNSTYDSQYANTMVSSQNLVIDNLIMTIVSGSL